MILLLCKDREGGIPMAGRKPKPTAVKKLEERIKRDRKNPGVLIELRKSNMIFDIVSLINLGVITKDDLKEKVDFILR